MKQDSKIVSKIFGFIGGLIVVWFALLVAPILDGGLVNFLKKFPKVIEQPYKIEIVKGSIKTIIVFLIIYFFAILIHKTHSKNYRRQEEYGSAEWGDLKAIRKKYMQEDNQNILLTQNIAIGLNARKHRRNLNVVVVGGSRKWKN